jgi:hypothetical protein
MQGNQDRSGNAEFDRKAEQDNGQPIRRRDNRRNTTQGNMSGPGARGSMSGGSLPGPAPCADRCSARKSAARDLPAGRSWARTGRQFISRDRRDGSRTRPLSSLAARYRVDRPEYHSYEHVRLPDRIAIVDPRTRHIVFVIDEGRDREGRANCDSRARFALSPQRKRAIHSEIVRDYRGDRNPNFEFEVRVGDRVPEAIELIPTSPIGSRTGIS